MRYRLTTGFFAFILNRLSGVILAVFLIPHFFSLYFIGDAARYEAIRDFYNTPVMRFSELALLGIVLAHGLNGIRLILLEAGAPTRLQKVFFWTALSAGALILLISIPHMMWGAR
ncbi:MAG: hypothetical protein M0018_07050 [Nitrospiraceae bacterium]|nr:hypothetical protein [Nitrospiraceae bacterium]